MACKVQEDEMTMRLTLLSHLLHRYNKVGKEESCVRTKGREEKEETKMGRDKRHARVKTKIDCLQLRHNWNTHTSARKHTHTYTHSHVQCISSWYMRIRAHVRLRTQRIHICIDVNVHMYLFIVPAIWQAKTRSYMYIKQTLEGSSNATAPTNCTMDSVVNGILRQSPHCRQQTSQMRKKNCRQTLNRLWSTYIHTLLTHTFLYTPENHHNKDSGIGRGVLVLWLQRMLHWTWHVLSSLQTLSI